MAVASAGQTTLLQTDKHTDTLSLNFYKPMLFLCQSTANSMHTDYKLWCNV